ncbi:MAG TPA: hypothetical protein VFJ84_01900 [Candidatus Saccharimonadales bacterium]|nr:hypothetical protein [Candidatus Saccharimonadales bacterium]
MRKSLAAGLSLVIILAALLYFRPVAAVRPELKSVTVSSGAPVRLPWPAAGQAAFGAAGYGLLESKGPSSPVPIASITKVITALAILQKKPIAAGGQGPVITFGKDDVDLFNYYYLHDGSVAKISSGERLTEYQALEAMMLPSANNVADSLAIWAFGSMQAYVDYANSMVSRMGLLYTTVGGASGFSDNTTSTAEDLVRLGLAALKSPVLKSVVGEKDVNLPVAGAIRNVNWLLGQDGVVGIKTGNTGKAGGCYLYAAVRNISGQDVTVVGSILGAPDLNSAISQADRIIKSADAGFQKLVVVHKGQKLGQYQTAWGPEAAISSPADIPMLIWKGSAVKISVNIHDISAPARAGAPAGSITVSNSEKKVTSQVVLGGGLSAPSWRWRIFHR